MYSFHDSRLYYSLSVFLRRQRTQQRQSIIFIFRIAITSVIEILPWMGFKISLIVILTAILCFSSQSRDILGQKVIRKSQPTKHGEVYRAKSQIDSLIYKLTLDLNTFNEKKTLATLMQEDAERLARIAEEEIALLKPVQHLLHRLIKGNASSGYQPLFNQTRRKNTDENCDKRIASTETLHYKCSR